LRKYAIQCFTKILFSVITIHNDANGLCQNQALISETE
jgi:hypothetical protein